MSYGQATTYADSGYAGFGARLAAWLIDAVIIGIINVPLNLLAGRLDPGGGNAAIQVLGGLITVLYFVCFWGGSGQTPGKRVMHLRVVGPDGGGIGYGRAFLRYIGYAISGLVFCLGYLWIIWDGEKQGWHDKIAGTHVVRG